MKKTRILFFVVATAILLHIPLVHIRAADNIVYVDINGLVCDFCARALEKVFGEEDSVSSISVNLDDKVLTVNLQEGKSINDDRLTELVQDAGYNVEAIRR